MTDGDAIYRSILAEPSEDLHRLAYADWLDERGRPGDAERAEFIRIQCELWRADPGRREGCGSHGLVGRERQILENHNADQPATNRHAWSAGLHSPGFRFVRFERGFPSSVGFDGDAWVAVGDLVTRRYPIRRVELSSLPRVGWSGPAGPTALLHIRFLGHDRTPAMAFQACRPAARYRMAAALLCHHWRRISFDLPVGPELPCPVPGNFNG